MVNFREFVTSSGLRVFGGRDAENNDKLVWDAKPKDVLLHTNAPGSPFVNLGEEPSKNDISESAVFCTKYSQEWRDTKRDVIVNKFQRSNMNKPKNMKAGSWQVNHQEEIRVKKTDILKYEKELRSGGIALGE